MKIKNDFVTNSSSCSYIVCIPNAEKFINEVESAYGKLPDSLKNSLYSKYGYLNLEDFDYDKFYELHKVVKDLGYVIMYLENGSEDNPSYINIMANDELRIKLKKFLEEI
jgi:hypothetical protein